ncbi:cysteine desulfurase / selenocysteine lyase [Ardenticatena maritima]|uniref:Cysteine desulfurase n=1 Tax=Ardenticatena maritima TaxID=872965 RepID=A0A0M8K9E1_9CHLR|nr:cysteine desulfurase [Ardenticatena maritima]KPL88343.1 cysteine desulfurase [Ardenticatena maritima]GAP64493.1 cysteine desulfurase / selenocysteine lyase [Ardenticatena maritima]
MYDIEAIRQQFPILQRQVHGKPLVYLDSAATSQKPLAVIDAMDRYYREYNANVHRGVHTLSEEATAAYEGARKRIARFINARSPRELIYTRNATEAINLVAATWGRANLTPNDAVLITEMEHHSNIVPWQILRDQIGFELRAVPVTDEGYLDMDAFDRLLDERVKLVAVTHMSNVLGTINPIAEMTAKAHAVGALVLVDGAQSVPHMPVDVQALDIDFLAFSAHKMAGPTGIGALWARRELLEAMPPYMGGGDMIAFVSLERSTWADLPHKFEAGTPAIAEAIGFGAAVDFLSELGMENVRAHEIEITEYALEALSEVPGLRLLGPRKAADKGGVAAFVLDGVHPHDIASILDAEGVAVRAGHHCAQPLMQRYNVPATTRASFYVYTTREEIDRLVEALHVVRKVFA